MKKILLITAHPADQSFTRQITEEAGKIAHQGLFVLQVIDLYRAEQPQPFYTYQEHPFPREHTIAQKHYQEKVRWADELIFVFPVWAGDCPAVMKNWFDTNWIPGFAYRYINGRVVGLLQGRSVRVICTYGSPSIVYTLLGITRAMKRIWKTVRIDITGMRLKGFYTFGDFDTGRADRVKVLQKIIKLLSRTGRG